MPDCRYLRCQPERGKENEMRDARVAGASLTQRMGCAIVVDASFSLQRISHMNAVNSFAVLEPCRPTAKTVTPRCAHALASGRTVTLNLESGQEELVIRSPQGAVEVYITFTEDGPVVKVHAARLDLEATREVALRARRFEVATTEGMSLQTAGGLEIAAEEVRVASRNDIHMNGATIRLNC